MESDETQRRLEICQVSVEVSRKSVGSKKICWPSSCCPEQEESIEDVKVFIKTVCAA